MNIKRANIVRLELKKMYERVNENNYAYSIRQLITRRV